ncbi:hypothetical protein BGK37_10785 [Pasteurella multocida]|nr:hypothetical protein BGK37_10785 [Pasteurella multocida]
MISIAVLRIKTIQAKKHSLHSSKKDKAEVNWREVMRDQSFETQNINIEKPMVDKKAVASSTMKPLIILPYFMDGNRWCIFMIAFIKCTI